MILKALNRDLNLLEGLQSPPSRLLGLENKVYQLVLPNVYTTTATPPTWSFSAP